MVVGVQAQTPTFAEGDEIVSLGIGLGGGAVYGMPITLSYEKGMKNINDKSAFGLGGSISYQSKNYNTANYYDKYGYTGMTIAVVGSFHYDLVDNFDLFASASLGYSMGQVVAKNDGVTSKAGENYLYYGINLGARYYFTEELGAYVTLGATPSSFLSLGVAYRFDLSSLFK